MAKGDLNKTQQEFLEKKDAEILKNEELLRQYNQLIAAGKTLNKSQQRKLAALQAEVDLENRKLTIQVQSDDLMESLTQQ